ncbi:MAG: glycine cleavage system protein GcvH [Chlorobi bacterium]|nr:glycine cleavage system protein GcvH [Chlorobiota bacterium]MCI0717224.1 glycine cleavage system protein GcvH [Chlorobiota bacterium]
MNIPEDLKYTKEHEWIKVNGNVGTVGITDYAQGELGDIIYVDVTTIGNEVKQGDTFGTIEAVKTVSDMYAPVSGKIKEFNSSVNDNPAIVNQDPYGAGWLAKMEISNMGDLDNLLPASEYKKLVGA